MRQDAQIYIIKSVDTTYFETQLRDCPSPGSHLFLYIMKEKRFVDLLLFEAS